MEQDIAEREFDSVRTQRPVDTAVQAEAGCLPTLP